MRDDRPGLVRCPAFSASSMFSLVSSLLLRDGAQRPTDRAVPRGATSEPGRWQVAKLRWHRHNARFSPARMLVRSRDDAGQDDPHRHHLR